MSTAEEPVNPPVAEEPAPVAEPTADAAAQPDAAPAQEPAAKPVDFFALLADTFKDDTEDPRLDEIAKQYSTPEALAKADPVVRAAARAMLRTYNAEQAKVKDAAVAREAEVSKREQAAQAALKDAQRQKQALLDMAAKAVPNPGAAPTDADPFTPEGQRKLIEYEARKAASEAWKPMLEEREQVRVAQAWQSIVDAHPELRDQKEVDAFDAWFAGTLNKGIDLTKQAPVMSANHAADLYFSQKAAEKLQAEIAQRQQQTTAARAASARAIGRSAGVGAADPLAYARQLQRSGQKEELMEYLQANPKVREAYIAAHR